MTDLAVAPPVVPAHASRRRAAIGAAIGLGVASALSILVGLRAQLSFFGESSTDQYSGWIHRPLMLAGAVGLIAAAVAIWWVSRRAFTDVTVALAIVVLGVCVLVGGVIDLHHRDHPQGFLLHAVTTISTPVGLTTDVSSVGDQPPDTSLNLRAAPPQYGPPVGVRSWGPTTCAGLGDTLQHWADNGSTRRDPSIVLGAPPCLYRATFHGWPVFADILQQQTSGYAQVLVSTPGNVL